MILNRRILSMFFLGFSAGLPLLLIGSTLKTWMAVENVSLQVIGLFSLVTIPSSINFLMAPFLDRYPVPLLGKRRGWLLVSQVGLAVVLAAMAFVNPAKMPVTVAALAVAVSFLNSFQNISLDAFRRELLPENELGIGSSSYVLGFRFAMFIAGAVALYLADVVSWKTVYLLMAALMGVGMLASLLSPEPDAPAPPETLQDAVVLPVRDFLGRPGIFLIFAFVLFYKSK